MASAAFSVPFCRPTFVCCFLGVVNFVKIPEFLAMKTSTESKKLNNEQFYRAVKEKQKYDQALPDIYIPNPHPTPWEGEKIYHTFTVWVGPKRESLPQIAHTVHLM
jgi:hypothetical protein